MAAIVRAAEPPPEWEKPGLNKLARITATEHSTILFTLADERIGYAKDGRVEWIDFDRPRGRSEWSHPALSHDGTRVAFVSGIDESNRRRIIVHDIATGARRNLIEVADDPGEMSWSWDDGEIVFWERGLSVVSVRDGAKRAPFTLPRELDGDRISFWVWFPMLWLHNDEDLITEVNVDKPVKGRPNTFRLTGNLLLLRGRDAYRLDAGSRPAIAPQSDRVAYYGADGLVAINADGRGRAVLCKAPTSLLFTKEDFFGPIVWSPDETRLFFGTLVSENRSDKLYLLDVKSGHSKLFQAKTSLHVEGWR